MTYTWVIMQNQNGPKTAHEIICEHKSYLGYLNMSRFFSSFFWSKITTEDQNIKFMSYVRDRSLPNQYHKFQSLHSVGERL